MAPANSLDELRRRIGHGTTPVAFAALAEEHRRAGRLDEAVAVCREGLERYPTYASARVTLGRALLDLGDVQGAFEELEEAVAQAPDNLAAARALDMARARLGDATDTATAEPSNDGTTETPETMTAWLTEGSSAPEATEPAGETALPEPSVDDPAPEGQSPPDALAWLGPVGDEDACDGVALSFASESPGDAPEPFEWGAAPTDSACTTWDASVEEALADVFAEASGSVIDPVAADSGASTDSHLDSLQSLLESIRTRRAELSDPRSDVD